MQFEGSTSNGIPVIELKRSVTDWQDKNNVSPPETGRNIIIIAETCKLLVLSLQITY